MSLTRSGDSDAGIGPDSRDKGIYVEAELLPAKVNISRDDFDTVCAALKDAGIGYTVDYLPN